MHELGVACLACFCTFYTSEMNTQSYMPMQYYPGDSGLASYSKGHCVFSFKICGD